MVHNAFHQGHSHGRVFHGIEARNLMETEKRDEAKLDNKMRFIHNRPGDAAKGAGKEANIVETVYSQVYVTETGPSPVAQVTPTAPAAPAKTPETDNNGMSPQQASYLSAKSAAQVPNTSAPTAASSTHVYNTKPEQRTRETSSHTAVTVPTQRTRTTAISSGTIVAAAIGGTPLSHTREATAIGGTPISATRAPDPVISEKTHGMSTGGKAGLAIGILLLIAAACGLTLFCWRRKKQQAKMEGAEQLDEKRATKDSFFGGSSAAAARGPQRQSMQSEKSFHSTRTAATAPRLSLRPVTQFLPNILGGDRSVNNNGAPAMSEKPRANPFDDSAALSEKSMSDPFADGAGAAAATKTSPGHSQSNSWEGSEPATPKSASFGTAAAVPIAASNGPNGTARGPNIVHRVQLDFKPSMEDELELRSGQLVRMVHEYDDGWALCMRMDRSQQGVCPRTCLSKLPVKPRPQGPPPHGAPNGRPMGPPPNGMRRPSSPQVGNAMMPRPLTPTGRERSHTLGRHSPAPGAGSPAMRPRSQSVSGVERPISPTGIPARKPVPGQAL